MYKALVIDLDGTLLNDNKEAGKEDYQSLIDAGKNNIIRIIATGRSLYSFKEVIPDNFPVDFLIFDAGAGIMDFKTKQILKKVYIPSGKVKEIALKLNSLQLDFQVRNKIPESHKYYYKRFYKENPDFDRLNNLYKNDARLLKNINELSDAARFIVISPDDGIVNIIENEFSKEFCIIRASSPIDNKSVWMEIYPKNTNKGSSLNYLCGLLNIKLSETIGLGNDYNDIHFLNITGKSYIVENAPDILKKKYLTTVCNNNNPLTDILKKETLF